MKNVWIIMMLWVGLWGQENSNAQSIKTTYKIRIAAMSKAFDKAIFNDLEELGVVMYEPADNGYTRIYLGVYLGKTTANKILAKVKRRGYKSAYLVQDTYIFQSVDNRELTRTLQFSAVKCLNLTQVVASLRESDADVDFYVWYSNGYYRLCLGLIAADNTEATGAFRQVAAGAGYPNTLLRQFRTATQQPVVIESGTLNDAIQP